MFDALTTFEKILLFVAFFVASTFLEKIVLTNKKKNIFLIYVTVSIVVSFGVVWMVAPNAEFSEILNGVLYTFVMALMIFVFLVAPYLVLKWGFWKLHKTKTFRKPLDIIIVLASALASVTTLLFFAIYSVTAVQEIIFDYDARQRFIILLVVFAIATGMFFFGRKVVKDTQSLTFRVFVTGIWFLASVVIGIIAGSGLVVFFSEPALLPNGGINEAVFKQQMMYTIYFVAFFSGASTIVVWQLLKKIRPNFVVEDHGQHSGYAHQQTDNHPDWKDITPEPERMAEPERILKPERPARNFNQSVYISKTRRSKSKNILLTLLWFVVSIPIGFVVGIAIATLFVDPNTAVRYGANIAWVFAGVTTWALWAYLKGR